MAYKHILVPVDGSPTSLQAVAKAAELAKIFGSKVTAIYVIDPYPFTGVGADFAYGQSQYLSAATAEAQAALTAARDAFGLAGITATTAVVEGHVVHRGIVQTAQEIGADLLVIGSHGRRGLEKLVLGSVTQRVLSEAHLPVLVVRE
ncbi:universal stress protein [Xylophilus sp.]|uniref:universal stress protein n=1 Tax=Xylophilus sp. TaxID=2653893 RepID=UPI0013B8FE9C|nr:universal stress protein [Xylophilus sp.]KAF1044012.1 MAG: TRAP-T-associated universal stress protein TeaD [Xylophilus sp.]